MFSDPLPHVYIYKVHITLKESPHFASYCLFLRLFSASRVQVSEANSGSHTASIGELSSQCQIRHRVPRWDTAVLTRHTYAEDSGVSNMAGHPKAWLWKPEISFA